MRLANFNQGFDEDINNELFQESVFLLVLRYDVTPQKSVKSFPFSSTEHRQGHFEVEASLPQLQTKVFIIKAS